jgi:hypothetical protein
MFYVVLKPDRTPMESPFMTMAEAQQAVADAEPDIVLQSNYRIHPIHNLSDLKALNVKHRETVTIEKFDGEYVGQPPVEVVEFKYGDS